MGEKNKFQELTPGDILSVILYRSGIIISALSFIYTLRFIFLQHENRLSGFFSEEYSIYVFWIFIISVNISVSFLHLYSKKVLNIIRSATYLGTMIILGLLATGSLDIALIFKSQGLNGKVGVLGLGLVLAGFSGIGAKEAFCFRLYEGYVYGILLALLVLAHLFGLIGFKSGYIPLMFTTAVITVFTVRKMFLPLHYDIGDKSRY